MTETVASTRKPFVAGAFYPAAAAELRASVAHYMGAANEAAQAGAPLPVPKAIIAPHAGYVYSGPIAATAYARILPAAAHIRRVVLLGPSHRVGFREPSFVNLHAIPKMLEGGLVASFEKLVLDLDMLRWSAMLGAVEALMCGTTAIVDHHESPNAIEGSLSVIAEACAEVGVNVLCAYGVTDRHGADGARRGLAENERFLRAGGRGMVGVHAAFTCSDDTLATAAGLATELGVGVHIHVAEGVDDIAAGERLQPLARDDGKLGCTEWHHE